MNAPGFWDDPDAAQKTVAEMKRVKAGIEPIQEMLTDVNDLREFFAMAREENDAQSLEEVDRNLAELEQRGDRIELQALLSEPNDVRNAFVTITAGAGGTEAQDWCEMLFRMYLYYFERAGFKVEETDRQPGEQAGLKYVSLHVSGPYAFGYLKTEVGVHRLVRPSPFNANNKRQTSFASVDVLPEFEEDDTAIEIPDSELEVEAFARSSGPGRWEGVASTASSRHLRLVAASLHRRERDSLQATEREHEGARHAITR